MTKTIELIEPQWPVVAMQQIGYRPRVMMFTDSFLRGGTESQFVRLVKDFDRVRYDLVVGCLQRHGPLLSEVERLGVPIVEFSINSLHNFRTMKVFLQLVRFLRRKRIEILHAFGFYTSIFAVPAARVAGVPVALASHRELLDLRGPWQRRAILFACRLATGIVVNSRAAGHDLMGPGCRKRVDVLPNCINQEEFKPRVSRERIRQELGLSATSIVIGSLGNLRPEKDVGTFLLAAQRILNELPSAEFLVIGDGPAGNDLKVVARDLGLSEAVHFVGERSDVADLIGGLDILVMTSYTESFPNAILEAMAIGKPVVATSVGGVPELLDDGKNGFLVPPRSPEAVADRVLLLCGNATRRLQMGLAGRVRVQSEFTVPAMTKKLETIYLRSLTPHRRPAFSHQW